LCRIFAYVNCGKDEKGEQGSVSLPRCVGTICARKILEGEVVSRSRGTRVVLEDNQQVEWLPRAVLNVLFRLDKPFCFKLDRLRLRSPRWYI
jgi:hypothetical protein